MRCGLRAKHWSEDKLSESKYAPTNSGALGTALRQFIRVALASLTLDDRMRMN